MDSDDWIAPDMYEVLVEKKLEGVYDVVNCQLIRDKGNDEEANFRPEENDITFVKINWLRSWLKDQGVEV